MFSSRRFYALWAICSLTNPLCISSFGPVHPTTRRQSVLTKNKVQDDGDESLSPAEDSAPSVDDMAALASQQDPLAALEEVSLLSMEALPKVLSEPTPRIVVRNTSFQLPLEKPILTRKKLLPWKKRDIGKYKFEYEYSELELHDEPSTAVLLIHPIGVGIGRWYYNRLLSHLANNNNNDGERSDHVVLLAPDLLGSSSACHPIIRKRDDGKEVFTTKLPLLTIDDWSSQLLQFMKEYGEAHPHVKNWCIVANGGCASVGLDIARQQQQQQLQQQQLISTSSGNNSSSTHTVNQVILSAPPRLSGLLRESPNPKKLQRTYYRILLGWPGKLFWWYALRNDGAFIQRFSERNLAESAQTLGTYWRSQCLESAKCYRQRSKHSTFAFLAGALQRNCEPCFDALAASTSIRVDLILPKTNVAPNGAKSWLWQKRKSKAPAGVDNDTDFQTYLQDRGLGGASCRVGGRRCVAHEDAIGFGIALFELLGNDGK